MSVDTSLTKAQWRELEVQYDQAVFDCEESFEFMDETMYTAYAKHLLKSKIDKKYADKQRDW